MVFNSWGGDCFSQHHSHSIDIQGRIDVSSQYGNFSTKKAFGYSIFGILGMELAEWEMLLGLRWSKVEFSDIKSGASNFSLSGTNFMFGLGWGF